jgi:hypothetical protein
MKLRWHRLLTSPKTRVLSRDGDVTRLQVDGLVCDQVCAVRTKQGLRSIEGVRDVSVDFESGVATIIGAPASEEEYERAVTKMVTGRGLRGLLERAAHHVRRAPPEGAP